MPARLFTNRIPPQPIRTFLILFALALTLPLLGLAIFALNQMASAEEVDIERRVMQAAEELAGDIDRELDRITVTLLEEAGAFAGILEQLERCRALGRIIICEGQRAERRTQRQAH